MHEQDDTAMWEPDPDKVEAMLAARLHGLDPERWPLTQEEVRRRLGLGPGPNRLQ